MIKSDYGDYLKKNKGQDNCSTQRNNCSTQRDNCNTQRNNCNTQIDINYVVYVPKNVHITVKSINGSVFVENFQGNLETNLVSGNVEVKNYTGELMLKTVSGNLDVTINKAKIDAKTVTGTIYSDLDITISDKENKNFDSHIKGVVNNGSQLTALTTVSGNVYMRKR